MRLPLIGGSYSPRSIIANAQRCINYYPERNTKDSPVPVTHYQRPGLRPLVNEASGGAWRGVYWCSANQKAYGVLGNTVYQILGGIGPSATWTLKGLGQIATNSTTPVSFTDNRITILLVDGSTSGYQIDVATNEFSLFVDPTGTFLGAVKVDYMDTFIIWPFLPPSNVFGSTLSNETTIDPLYIAAKTDYVDNLAT